MNITHSLDDELRRRREREALERSFERFRFKVGKRTWKRADLYARKTATMIKRTENLPCN